MKKHILHNVFNPGEYPRIILMLKLTLCWKKFGSKYLSNLSINLISDGFHTTSYVKGIFKSGSSFTRDSDVKLTSTI